MQNIIKGALLATAAIGPMAMPVAAYAQTASRNYSIAPQPLDDALRQFAVQSGRDVVFDPKLVEGKSSSGLQGSYSAEAGLRELIKGSNIALFSTSNGFALRGNGGAAAETAASLGHDATSESRDAISEGQEGIAEILVVGSRSQNVDIRRTENDPQPYVVMDAKEIERSQATTLNEFLQKRLPMNAAIPPGQASSSIQHVDSNLGSVNLRGIGVNQTLILVDGRRAPRMLTNGNELTQADINGIPLAAIERIEILPATAGGIYGGGAVGGVINIIRKRNFRGLTMQAVYNGTFEGGGESLRLDLTGGFAFEGGRTQVNFSASQINSNPLYKGDRDFWRREQQLMLERYPELFYAGGWVGQTPNIRPLTCLARDALSTCVSYPNLTLDDGRPLGSFLTFVPEGYPGPTDGGTAFLANAGHWNLDLADDGTGQQATLMNNPRIRSANINLRREFSSAVDSFLDFSISENLGRSRASATLGGVRVSANAPNNPFRQDILVYTPTPEINLSAQTKSVTTAAAGGLIIKLGNSWSAVAEYDWSKSKVTSTNYSSALTITNTNAAFSNGTIDVIRDVTDFPTNWDSFLRTEPTTVAGPYTTEQNIASARAAGNLVDLPGGAVGMTVLLENRRDKAKPAQSISQVSANRFLVAYAERKQTVNSAYVELRVPIFSDRNTTAILRELELQLSLRHDRYQTRASEPPTQTINLTSGQQLQSWSYQTTDLQSTNYTVAARYVPLQGITFRGSFGTGFLPPGIDKLGSSINEVAQTALGSGALDPRRGNRRIGSEQGYTGIGGGNPNLRPEESKSLSIGLILSPTFLTGFRFSVDYSKIHKTNEIVLLTPTEIINNEELFPDRVVRGANLPGDPLGWPGPVILFDNSYVNLAQTKTQAYDFQVDYDFDSVEFGRLRLYGIATHQSQRWLRIFESSTPVDTAGFVNGPLKWRANFGFDWSRGPWEVSWNTQFYAGYSVRRPSSTNPTGGGLSSDVILYGERFPRQFYHDIAARHRVGPKAPGPLRNVEFSVGIQNIFNKSSPIGAFYGDPRLRRFSLSVRKSIGL